MPLRSSDGNKKPLQRLQHQFTALAAMAPREYRVVVTSFGPFGPINDNPSPRIKDGLPSRIEREGRPSINIFKYPTLRNYLADMEKVTAIWSRDPKAVGADGSQDEDCYVDAMLHLGMNNSTGWQLESRAARDTYSWTGDDGVPLPTDNGGEGGRFEGMPAELWTMFDVPRMADGLAKEYPGLDIQASTNAGGAYCEFILFTSLAALRARGEAGRALFLHVPGMKAADEDIRDSVKVATSVIQRIVDEQ